MDGVGAVGSTDAMLVRAAETDTDKSVKLLKKSMQSEQDMVATLLPPPPGKLDIKA
jgi:hypothetical protein